MSEHETDEPSCECCGFKPVEVESYRQNRSRFRAEPRMARLCRLCAGTMAGNAFEYPEQFSEGRSGDVMRTICYVGNAIIESLKGGKR